MQDTHHLGIGVSSSLPSFEKFNNLDKSFGLANSEAHSLIQGLVCGYPEGTANAVLPWSAGDIGDAGWRWSRRYWVGTARHHPVQRRQILILLRFKSVKIKRSCLKRQITISFSVYKCKLYIQISPQSVNLETIYSAAVCYQWLRLTTVPKKNLNDLINLFLGTVINCVNQDMYMYV